MLINISKRVSEFVDRTSASVWNINDIRLWKTIQLRLNYPCFSANTQVVKVKVPMGLKETRDCDSRRIFFSNPATRQQRTIINQLHLTFHGVRMSLGFHIHNPNKEPQTSKRWHYIRSRLPGATCQLRPNFLARLLVTFCSVELPQA